MNEGASLAEGTDSAFLRGLGYGWIGAAWLAGAAACLAVSWPLLVGGAFDLAGADPIETGIGVLDNLDDDTRADWGQREVGLLKIFVLAPLAIALIALATRGLVKIGRRMLVDARPEPAIAIAPSRAEVLAPPAPPPAAAESTAPRAPPRPASTRLRMGEIATLRGIDRERTLVEATVVELVDPLAGGRTPGVQRADRLVGIRISLSNRGEDTFEDIPSGGSLVLTDDGRSYKPAPGTHAAALREIRLAPGETGEGMLTFRLPLDAQLLAFCFTPNLGVAPDSGEWSLAPEPPPEGEVGRRS